ncbi:efflux RND transporter periplasmic adaptor subunit [Prochlorothrix hollandica]|uniref:efflux RND transporter periplasmic adaptor subunit n=1 Tax=Prochlorothrix hollandica TaxID=1223 RepID=UPI000345EF1E|nr:efflux RND transporter periplasmic adaptor subunit [Prochlorothrix hollandica]
MTQDFVNAPDSSPPSYPSSPLAQAEPASPPAPFASSQSPGQTWRLGAIALGGILLIGGIVVWRGGSPGEPAAAPETPALVPAKAVTLAPVQSQAISRRLDTTGTVQAQDLLPIAAQASNLQIQEVRVDEGDAISPGQVLVVLDSTTIQAQIQQGKAQLASAQARVRQQQASLAQAQATLKEAQSNLQRFQALAADGAISAQELETRSTTVLTAQESVRLAQANITSAQAEVQSQQAQLNQLTITLNRTQVKAPTAGIVAERFARVGNLASDRDPLFSVIRDGLLELEISLPETQLPQVKVGARVNIRSDSDPSLQLQGSVASIAPLVDPATRQARIKVNLPPSSKLRPGMFLQAAVVLSNQTGLTVPAAAVLTQPDGSNGVYRWLGSDQVALQVVTVGQVMDSADPTQARMEILQGLNPGDQVVVEGAGYLKDGDRVQITPDP